jgi:hypothetical protein
VRMRRSTQMLLIGVAVFAIGAGVVGVTLSGSGGGGSTAAPAATTSTTAQAGTVVIPPAGTLAGTPVGTAPGTAPASTFTIPNGKQAVAVQLAFVAGLAGYAQAGDLVNLYGTVEKGQTGAGADLPPAARLILPAVQVLTVSGPGLGSGDGKTTFLLALDAVQAEQAIFFSRFESLWMTLVPKGQPAASTPGRNYKNAF